MHLGAGATYIMRPKLASFVFSTGETGATCLMSEGWHVKGQRRGGRGGKESPELAALAKQLRASLVSEPRATRRKPEWQCTTCTTFNFMDRACCRRCECPRNTTGEGKQQRAGGARPGGGMGLPSFGGQRLPPGSAWAAGPPTAPNSDGMAIQPTPHTAITDTLVWTKRLQDASAMPVGHHTTQQR